MPEGDTIHRLAARLSPLLVRGAVTAFAGRRIADDAARDRVGRSIVAVEAHGKNLFCRFDDGVALHVHLGMRAVRQDPAQGLEPPVEQLPLLGEGARRGHGREHRGEREPHARAS